MGGADFWSDTERAKKVSKHAADIRSEIEAWDGLQKEAADLQEMAELAQAEGQEGMRDDIDASLKALEARFGKMEFAVLFSGPYDGSNAILSIHAGSGGTEANDWSEMLFRMYVRFAER